MLNNKNNNEKQQFSTKPTPETNRQIRKKSTVHKLKKKTKNLEHIHISQFEDRKNHHPVQKH